MDYGTIRKMFDEAEFSPPPVSTTVPMSTSIRLSIRLQEASYSHGDSYLSISGFPRLVDGDLMTKELRASRRASGSSSPSISSSSPPRAYTDVARQAGEE